MYKTTLIMLFCSSLLAMDAEHSQGECAFDDVELVDKDVAGERNGITCREAAIHEGSLAYRRILNWWDPKANPWWSPVSKDTIVSGIPLAGSGELEEIMALALREKRDLAVLSLLERHEIETGWSYRPVSTDRFKELNIKRDVVMAEDWTGLSLEDIKKGIGILRKNQKNDLITIINCKAGVGRSVSLAMANEIVDGAEKLKGKDKVGLTASLA